MSHEASAGFDDVVTPENIISVYPQLKPLFKAVTKHKVWDLLYRVNGWDCDNVSDVVNELFNCLDHDIPEKKVRKTAEDFVNKFKQLQKAFDALVGCTLSSTYLPPDQLDRGAEICERYWFLSDHMVLRSKVTKAKNHGLHISRCFYVVNG